VFVAYPAGFDFLFMYWYMIRFVGESPFSFSALGIKPKWTEQRSKRIRYCAPHPWKRTGPGKALDGKPKFDLEKLDDDYFNSLRSRLKAAGKRGVYCSIKLFEG
jgi:hypothetical protein